jgi:hypothetical protein
MNLLVNVRSYGGTYIARALKLQASCTMGEEQAAKAVVIKVLGNHLGDEPRLLRLNASQFMADVTKLEGFETVNEGECSNCCAEHKIMFKRRRRVFCTGCAVRERSRSNLFLLACTRGGRRHYVSGARADDGRWTKFKDRARRFTDEQARVAKGNSQAEIIPA